LPGSASQTRIFLHTGCYATATAEHREPCESRGSRTVLGAPGVNLPSATRQSLPIAPCFTDLESWSEVAGTPSVLRLDRCNGPS
jgi:hypothetical protein